MADQGEVLKRLTQGVPETVGSMNVAEAFDDPDELTRVSQYLTTVAEIERLTGLDFGDAVRNADVRTGEERGAIDDLEPNVTSKKRPSKSPRRESPTRKR